MGRLGSVLAVPIVAGLIACGGGPSKSAYVKKADAVCSAAMASARAVTPPSSDADLADAAKTLAESLASEVSQLRGIPAPDGDREQVDAVLAATTSAAGAASLVQDAAARADDDAIANAVSALSASYADATTKAGAYGYTACTLGARPGVDAVTRGAHDVAKARYVGKAAELCRAATDRAENLREPRTRAEYVRYLDTLVSIEAQLLRDLRALPVPPGDDGVVHEMLDAQQQSHDKLRALADAQRSGNDELSAAFLRQGEQLVTKANAKADAYGLVDCGTKSAF